MKISYSKTRKKVLLRVFGKTIELSGASTDTMVSHLQDARAQISTPNPGPTIPDATK